MYVEIISAEQLKAAQVARMTADTARIVVTASVKAVKTAFHVRGTATSVMIHAEMESAVEVKTARYVKMTADTVLIFAEITFVEQLKHVPAVRMIVDAVLICAGMANVGLQKTVEVA